MCIRDSSSAEFLARAARARNRSRARRGFFLLAASVSPASTATNSFAARAPVPSRLGGDDL
eukprot:12379652-Alexandrium_andersonii.AAC.1